MVRATYILRYIYSLKSYVVNLQRKWVLANQSSGRRFHTWKKQKTKQKQKQTKNDTSNQNRVRLFFTRERNDASDKKPEISEFRTKIPAFLGDCGVQRLCLEVTSQIFKEIRFFPRALLLGKGEAYRKLEWIVSYISLSMNSGRGKNRMRRTLKLYIFIGVILFSVWTGHFTQIHSFPTVHSEQKVNVICNPGIA